MSEGANTASEAPPSVQSGFQQVTDVVSSEFQVEQAFLEHAVPTYYLKQPQETKKPFLRLLKKLDTMNMIAFLRKIEGRIVLRVIPKPPVKPSNILINWGLFLATIATTFITGYIMLPPDMINPYVGGATFTIAILAVLGTHEMGHKLTANKRGTAATLPYFLPGLPPFGTFGAVIMQKSLPSNRDSLFDIGADGPIAGFIVAVIVSFIGLMFVIPTPEIPGTTYLQVPIIWHILIPFMQNLGLMPVAGLGQALLVHPVAFAGWVGVIVTMLNLLPAGMLDGGHVARSIAGDKFRIVFTALSVLYLLIEEFYPMAVLVLLISLYRHPGPLDDVSPLSTGRKLATVGIIAIFVLCMFPVVPPLL